MFNERLLKSILRRVKSKIGVNIPIIFLVIFLHIEKYFVS